MKTSLHFTSLSLVILLFTATNLFSQQNPNQPLPSGLPCSYDPEDPPSSCEGNCWHNCDDCTIYLFCGSSENNDECLIYVVCPENYNVSVRTETINLVKITDPNFPTVCIFDAGSGSGYSGELYVKITNALGQQFTCPTIENFNCY